MTAGNPVKSPPETETADTGPRPKSHLLKDILRIVVIAGMFGLVGYFAAQFENVDDVRNWLHPDDSLEDQFLSYIVFVGFGALLMALGLPRSLIAIAAGGIYGAVLGIALAMTTTLSGATITYMLGRSVLKGTVRRRVGQRRMRLLQRRFQENGFRYTLNLRLFPFTNATLTSLLCGLCRVDFREYTAANIIGFLPLTIVFCVFGSGAAKGKWYQLALGTVLFIVVMAAQWYIQRWMKGGAGRGEAEAEEEVSEQA